MKKVAFGNGHAAIMLVDDKKQGEFYSYVGDDNNKPAALTIGTPGYLTTVVDSIKNGKPTTFDVSSFFTGNGNLNNIGIIKKNDTYTNHGSFMSYNKKKDGYYYNTDTYSYGALIPITDEEGVAMHNKALEIRNNPGTYQVFVNNCNQIAQTILSACGKDFATTNFDWFDTKPNSVRDNLIKSIKESNTVTFSNSPYPLDESMNYKGWVVGTIKEIGMYIYTCHNY